MSLPVTRSISLALCAWLVWTMLASPAEAGPIAKLPDQARPSASPTPVESPAPTPSASPGGTANDPLSLGKQAYFEDRNADAVELLLQALRAGESAEVYDFLGRAYYKLGTYSLAIDAFESAQALAGEAAPPELLFSLAQSYYNARELVRAQDTYNTLLSRPDTSPELRRLAEEQLLQTLRDQSSAYQQAMADFQADNFAAAIKGFEEVLTLMPDSSEIHFYLGISAYQTLDFDRAKRSLQRVIELAPESEYAESARQNLEVIRKLEQNLPPRPFFGSITLGTLGDSNVNYGDSGGNRVTSNASQSALQDLGSLINLRLNYAFSEASSLRYQYLLNLYWGLNDSPERQLNSYDYNYQEHNLALSHRLPVLDWIVLDLETRSNLQVLAGEIYQVEAALRPTLTVYETERMISKAYLDLASQRYQNFSERDNFNYAFGLDQYLYLWNSQSWLRFGYRFHNVIARDNLNSFIDNDNGRFTEIEYRYASSRSDNQLGLGFSFPVGPLTLELGTLFDFFLYNQPDVYREYRISINPLTGLPLPRQQISSKEILREDTRLIFYTNLDWPLLERLHLLARYSRTTNVSNVSPEDIRTRTNRSYLKDQIDLSLRWEF